MGNARWDSQQYDDFARSTRGKSTGQIYTGRGIHADLDPRKIKVRESRDSVANPHSTPIIVALDVTGSMGILADNIARKGLGVLFDSILDRKPVTDPHLMFMGIGDAHVDSSPLQASQFEADPCIIEQLTKLFLEHGGGGNSSESYHLAWYFAAFKTVHDAMERRGQKGYLFTVGDEETPPPLTAEQVRRVVGDNPERSMGADELLGLASRVYNCYHIIIEEGSHARMHRDRVHAAWQRLLGERAIPLADHTRLAETIVSTIMVAEGHDWRDSWSDPATNRIVHEAVRRLPGATA